MERSDVLTGQPPTVSEEEKLVAELALLSIGYLSRNATYEAVKVRPAGRLLAGLVQQPSARVRAAVIAVLLAHPEYAASVVNALKLLSPSEQLTLRFFYTAAMLLQALYADRLRPLMATHWQPLPDMFSAELGLPTGDSPRDKLAQLGREHQSRTRTSVNWAGSYEGVAKKLLRRWELERQWNL